MRHGDKLNNLGRTSAHRKALMRNMTCSLIEHKRIITTLAKAKALRGFAEPLITRSKVDSTHNRRLVFSYLQEKDAVTELFTVIGDKVSGRPGGYTRIIKMPRRLGDAADMALIELVDFNELYTKDSNTTTRKTRRSRRGTGGAPAGVAKPTAATAAMEETAATEETAPPAESTEVETTVAEAPAADEVAPTTEGTPATEE